MAKSEMVSSKVDKIFSYIKIKTIEKTENPIFFFIFKNILTFMQKRGILPTQLFYVISP